MDNMQLWNEFCQPPAAALKPITGGRLSGKTDISPQWRVEALTKQFGPVGIGWKFEITKRWTEPGPDGQVFAFVDLSLYIKVNGNWSDPIPGNGGDFLVEKEKGGLHANDECWKMATTDALGNAMRWLGVAAAIYLGEWTGRAYREHDDSPPPTTGKAAFGGPQKGNGAPPQQNTPPAAPEQPKQFVWAKANSAERRDYVYKRVDALKTLQPADALAKLSNISKGIKPADFEQVDMDLIAKHILSAEQDFRAVGSGT